MGFHVEVNSIIRSDEPYDLVRGQIYDFKKSGSRVFFDTLQIWLTRSDWTPLAEIEVISQTRTPSEVMGQFKVMHVYAAEEQSVLTGILRRMYAAEGNPYIYLLMSGADYLASVAAGQYEPASLATEKFIHASPVKQLTRIANKYYKEVANMQVLVVVVERIKPEVKWEPATGGLYPHIYGPLNMDAVVRVRSVFPDASGVFNIRPEDLAAGSAALSVRLAQERFSAMEASGLDPETVESLWRIFLAICRLWENVADPESMRSRFRAFLINRIKRDPAYLSHYRCGVETVNKLIREKGEEKALEFLLLHADPGDDPLDPSWQDALKEVRKHVSNELIALQISLGGFKDFTEAINYPAYIAGVNGENFTPYRTASQS